MPYFAYIVGGWVQKEGKFCLRNKSMAPYPTTIGISKILQFMLLFIGYAFFGILMFLNHTDLYQYLLTIFYFANLPISLL